MTEENTEFDFQKALKGIQEGKPFTGKGGVLTSLIKNLAEAALEGELESHLGQEVSANRRNGKSKKTIKSLDGKFELETPRDRAGTFSPQIVKKHQTTLSDEIERKIIALYGLGMSYNDMASHLQEIYGLEISNATLSTITDKIIHTVKEWQARPLENVYPIVWLDAIHYKVRENGKVGSKAVYTILGLYISENEGANFWLQVLTDLSNRGVKDILIACVDGLKGFPEAIETIFPDTEVQLCVVHQIRNSLKYVGSKNKKEFMTDLKRVYKAVNKDLAEEELDILENKWNDKYPIVIKSWRNNWERLSHFFKYPEEIRRIIYTTNTIEAVHRQFRKLTKTKGSFPNQDSLLKLLYMGIQNASKKWTMPIQNWSLTISQLAIFFEGRLDKELGI
ncbi:MAG: IS256 family transposase [Desulfobacter sp.]|nr:IS256 family transposase [Desulfobacter sp.]